MTAVRPRLLVVVVAAALAEVLLLRVALRLGPVLPMHPDVLQVFAVVQWLGVVALNLGVLTAGAMLALTALDVARTRPRGLPLALLLVAAVAVNLGLELMVEHLSVRAAGALHGGVTGGAILAAVALASPRPLAVRAAVGLAGLAQLLVLAPAVGLATGQAVLAAEGAAVGAALALPWLFRVRPRRAESAVAAIAGIGVAVAGLVQPWGVATVAIWTLGFSFFLPPVVYGAALASAVVTIPWLFRRPGGAELAAGFVLIWLAGLKLDVSSVVLVGLTGLAVAARPWSAVPASGEVTPIRDAEWSGVAPRRSLARIG